MIVAEVKEKKVIEQECWTILSKKFDKSTKITYIMSIGVHRDYRRLGIASILLDKLLDYLDNEIDCKAIYLHVLATNIKAINFYEKQCFQKRALLPNYYTINGEQHDAFVYALYMNDGKPPWIIYDFIMRAWLSLKANNFSSLIPYLTEFVQKKIFRRDGETKNF
jgi:N-alpha-acetyltransferase 60